MFGNRPAGARRAPLQENDEADAKNGSLRRTGVAMTSSVTGGSDAVAAPPVYAHKLPFPIRLNRPPDKNKYSRHTLPAMN